MNAIENLPEIDKALEESRTCKELIEQIIKHKDALRGFGIEIKILFKGEEMN